MQSVGTNEFDLENIRKHLQRLSDEELIQFGKAGRAADSFHCGERQ